MKNIFKRVLTLSLAVLLVLGAFAGCGNTDDAPATTTEPVVTQPPEEAKVLKVLTLGHSLGNDANHMLSLVAGAEGFTDLEVGYLYYSGCRLSQHINFMNEDSKVYTLYRSSAEKPNVAPQETKNVTMKDALRADYWDIIIMQDGVFEIADENCYTNGNRQTVQNFVNEYKLNPTAYFAWNMTWVPPVDNDLRNTSSEQNRANYKKWYEPYGHDRATMYNAVCKAVENNILTDDTIKFVIPSGTVMENALSSYLEEKDIHRDYVHASNMARVMVSYLWYCKLAGIDKLEEIKLDTVPKHFLVGDAFLDLELTDAQKDIILEAVNNALANPLQMTQSQYTQAPAQ